MNPGEEGLLLLVAEPDHEVAAKLAEELSGHGIRVISCGDGAEALLIAGTEHPDAVLATTRLPIIGGAAFVRTLSSRTPIPVVLGVGDGDGPAAAEALAAGAAACVAYPYRVRELLPILRSITPPPLDAPGSPVECGGLRLDPASLTVHLHDRPIRLPMRELRLLHLLMTHADRVVTRDQIRDIVWGGEPSSNTVTVHVQRLRHRLGDDHQDPHLILTIRGVGYRLVPPVLTTNSR
ncbi:DNA-binding response OmpR family regulator [Allocatelliglobosispora scoriae]|uniref:DNA-binding response OmpR family regulator n=1 Tax=Allocatelliglobosispora scoriae TaxID=643052 RepID=A0A841BXF7_9ACTN|nr:response regulator transcription factor [Allocatelliglobosispora scoriae]MBB5872844.1 DNA-binding response OmpR family regulator [Allocatelliglobosispora scoriae]